MTPPPIRLRQVTLAHQGQVVLRDVSHEFAPGSLTAIIGPNGAGKTTLLRALAGLHPVHAGTIDRGGLALRQLALLPQTGPVSDMPLSCADVATLGLWSRIGPFSAVRRNQMAAVQAALARVGLAGRARQLVATLSAGQRQRLLFARLMLQDAPVLLLDEPFTALDEATAADLLAVIAAWHQEGRSIIAVLHDRALVARAFPLCLALDGALRAAGASAEVLAWRDAA